MNTNLAETLFRHAIGYDPLVRPETFQNIANFPPHNIIKLDDNNYRLTMAVAGFNKEAITIEVLNGLLTISGSLSHFEQPGETLYRGIALRDFKRQFKIGENVEVKQAQMADGMLDIRLERQIPDELRPKQIAIQ